MARFRLFGQPGGAEAAPRGPSASDRAGGAFRSGGPSASFGAGASGPGPATRSARPVPAGTGDDRWADQLTDPHGFPPVPPLPPPHGQLPALDPTEAAALAAAFAVDFLSWDQDDPGRRAGVLLDYLASAGGDPARLGWSGRGRQRAEFALAGLVRSDGAGRVLVDVRVRVTPYRPVGDHVVEVPAAIGATPDLAAPDLAGVPASAPAPTGPGWRSLASRWIRLSVPVTHDGGRLVVDAWEDAPGSHEPAPAATGPADEAIGRVVDDPLVLPGGAW